MAFAAVASIAMLLGLGSFCCLKPDLKLPQKITQETGACFTILRPTSGPATRYPAQTKSPTVVNFKLEQVRPRNCITMKIPYNIRPQLCVIFGIARRSHAKTMPCQRCDAVPKVRSTADQRLRIAQESLVSILGAPRPWVIVRKEFGFQRCKLTRPTHIQSSANSALI